MLERTHIPEAPWWVVEAVDKKRARLNCIAHLLTQIPYEAVPHVDPVLPARVHNPDYHPRADPAGDVRARRSTPPNSTRRRIPREEMRARLGTTGFPEQAPVRGAASRHKSERALAAAPPRPDSGSEAPQTLAWMWLRTTG